MNALLQINQIRKNFGSRVVLDIEQLKIEQACAYVLTGMNGSGKSTLLRILAGLETATIADASYMGQTLSLTPYPHLLRQKIVYVHQHPIMFSGTVTDNIAYGLRIKNTPDWRDKTEQAMGWAGVAHLSKHSAATLSGGEKQRVALARAKVLQPHLLLLDEPTSSLDGAAREQVIALIPTLIDAGSSVVLVCHDRELIALPGVHRFKLRDGKLENR